MFNVKVLLWLYMLISCVLMAQNNGQKRQRSSKTEVEQPAADIDRHHPSFAARFIRELYGEIMSMFLKTMCKYVDANMCVIDASEFEKLQLGQGPTTMKKIVQVYVPMSKLNPSQGLVKFMDEMLEEPADSSEELLSQCNACLHYPKLLKNCDGLKKNMIARVNECRNNKTTECVSFLALLASTFPYFKP